MFATNAKTLPDLVASLIKEDSDCMKGLICRLWSKECNEAFITLKDALTSTYILGFPDFSLPFILEVDSSFSELVAVLSQNQVGEKKVLAYAIGTFRPSKCNIKFSLKLEPLGLSLGNG